MNLHKKKKSVYIPVLFVALLLIFAVYINIRNNSCSHIYVSQKKAYDKGITQEDYTKIYNSMKKHDTKCIFKSKDPAKSVHYAHLEISSAYIGGKIHEGESLAKQTQKWLGKHNNLNFDDEGTSETTDIYDMANLSLPSAVEVKYNKAVSISHESN